MDLEPVQFLNCDRRMESAARAPPGVISILPPRPRVHTLHNRLKTSSRLTVALPTGQFHNTGRSLYAASIVRGPSGKYKNRGTLSALSGRWHTTATAHLYKLDREGER